MEGVVELHSVRKLLTAASHAPVVERNHHLSTRRRPLQRLTITLTPTPVDIAIIIPKLQHSSGSWLSRLSLCLCGCICTARQRGLHEKTASLLIDMQRLSSCRQPRPPLHRRS